MSGPGRLRPDELEDAGIDAVILAAPEMYGKLVGRRVGPAAFRTAVERGVTLTSCVLAWDVAQSMDVGLEYAGPHAGFPDVLLRPDVSTLRVAGWLERTAICLCDFAEVADGSPVRVAPRNVLRAQLAAAEREGLRPVVASELEFFLYRPGYDQARRDDYRMLEPTTLAAADFSVRHADAMEPYFSRLRQALSRSGIGVEFAQPETGLGQWEVTFGHDDALGAADDHVLFKAAVKAVAGAQGLSATFMARPHGDQIGSSGHLHLSLGPGGTTSFFDPEAPDGVGGALRSAVGGVLRHAPDVMPFYAPYVNSYKRTASDDFAGCGDTWGFDNRTTSCRVVGQDAGSLRFEYRVPGADVNPYLAVAALVASVRDGIARDVDPGPPATGNAYDHTYERLPADLPAAAARMRASALAEEAFGADVVDHYASLAEWEARQHAAAVTDWEVRRYFEAV